jgi:hypothetical protein
MFGSVPTGVVSDKGALRHENAWSNRGGFLPALATFAVVQAAIGLVSFPLFRRE